MPIYECGLYGGGWQQIGSIETYGQSGIQYTFKNYIFLFFRTDARRGEFYFDCCPNERFANVAFQIYLRRRYTFYIMNVILPSLMTSVLLLSIFFCTPAQKVQIGVVVLLSFRIFLLNVTDSIPKTSDHIPLLGKTLLNINRANILNLTCAFYN